MEYYGRDVEISMLKCYGFFPPWNELKLNSFRRLLHGHEWQSYMFTPAAHIGLFPFLCTFPPHPPPPYTRRSCNPALLVPLIQYAFELSKGSLMIQLNPALTDPPPMEQMQIHSLIKLISFIFFICNNGSPPITEENCWSPEIRQSGV